MTFKRKKKKGGGVQRKKFVFNQPQLDTPSPGLAVCWWEGWGGWGGCLQEGWGACTAGARCPVLQPPANRGWDRGSFSNGSKQTRCGPVRP